MTSPKRLARLAGLFYLCLAVFGGLAELYVRGTVVKKGDAAATAHNVVAHASLFRFGFVADLIGTASFLLTAMALFMLLKHVNKYAAAAMVTFVAVAVAITSANMLNHYAALLVATDPSFAAHFGGQGGSDQLTMMFLDLHKHGYLIAQIFFALWLFPLGYLVRNSGYFPKALGTMLMAGGTGYLVDFFFRAFLANPSETVSGLLTLPADIGELWMIGYLLIKGVRATRRDQMDLVAV